MEQKEYSVTVSMHSLHVWVIVAIITIIALYALHHSNAFLHGNWNEDDVLVRINAWHIAYDGMTSVAI